MTNQEQYELMLIVPKELHSIVKDLIREWESAKKMAWVRKPKAYALYQVWTEYDRRKEKTDETY